MAGVLFNSGQQIPIRDFGEVNIINQTTFTITDTVPITTISMSKPKLGQIYYW